MPLTPADRLIVLEQDQCVRWFLAGDALAQLLDLLLKRRVREEPPSHLRRGQPAPDQVGSTMTFHGDELRIVKVNTASLSSVGSSSRKPIGGFWRLSQQRGPISAIGFMKPSRLRDGFSVVSFSAADSRRAMR